MNTPAEQTQQDYFRLTNSVPQEGWYWAAMTSVAISAALWLAGKRDWSTFVGQWPPTFLLFGDPVANWVGGTHLLLGYMTLGILLARRPELTGAQH